jgi:hypothetical protein
MGILKTICRQKKKFVFLEILLPVEAIYAFIVVFQAENARIYAELIIC